METSFQLWNEIHAHFDPGNGVNPTRARETFVQDMKRRRRLLLDNDQLLSNFLLVLPQHAMDHTLWLGEHHTRDLSLLAAVQRRCTAEQSHQQLRQQGSTSAGDGLKADTVCVNCKAKGHWYGGPQCPAPMTPEQTAARAKREKIKKKCRAEKFARRKPFARLLELRL
ncbi:hypothetical protein GN958_ATG06454 [Phytophthora infestans]|uniref:Uncharacterized protein n=1 Tax=Phytophthora infestans TaxID=4787 RepID=A0A8S9UUI6_PHYIN|nr:hypothetical protein GN958_ATG06454 [Phytophthora infestans]